MMTEFSLGSLTKRDKLVIAQSKEQLKAQVTQFLDPKKSDEEAVGEFGLKLADKDMWNARVTRRSVKVNDIEQYTRAEAFRPFDSRFIFYHDKFVARLNRRVMRHLEYSNLAMITVRQLATLPFEHMWVTESLTDQHIISVRTKEGGVVFPLYLYPTDSLFDVDQEERRPNLAPEFVEEMSEAVGLRFVSDGVGDLGETFGPEDIFHYAYAVFHSPAYRERYAEFLKRDFPRLPLTTDLALFRELCGWGEELVSLHLMRSPYLDDPSATFPKSGSNVMQKATHDAEESRVYINKEGQHFDNVPEETWNFRVGGYQVLDKWLKDRKGRTLTAEDVEHYRKVVAALGETAQIMAAIDDVIEARGGWPLAGSVKKETGVEG